jgi:uncharacterized protein YxeA
MVRIIVFIFTVLNLSMTNVYAQPNSNIPEEVTSSFKEKYPNTFVYEWKWKKKKQLYKAEFFLRGVKYKAYFQADGRWVQTYREVKKADVPQAILDHLFASEYANWKIDDIEEQQTPDFDLIYEIELKMKNPKRKVYLRYLPNGKLVEREVAK